MYYIAASPLVKIFLPEWHDRLQADPDLIYDDKTAFSFNVVAGTRGVVVHYNRPQQTNDNDLYNWLVGGATGTTSRDTDIFGLVPFDPKTDILRDFDELTKLEEWAMSEDPEQAKKAMLQLKARKAQAAVAMREARAKVREQSEARIKRAIRLNHNNLIRQWQVNEEQKLGKYPPSIAEMLGSHALISEIEAAKNKGAELKKRASEMMNNPIV